jgi:hypothetical protein
MRPSTRRLIANLDSLGSWTRDTTRDTTGGPHVMSGCERQIAQEALRWASATLDRGGSQPFGICKWFDRVEDAIKELGR